MTLRHAEFDIGQGASPRLSALCCDAPFQVDLECRVVPEFEEKFGAAGGLSGHHHQLPGCSGMAVVPPQLIRVRPLHAHDEAGRPAEGCLVQQGRPVSPVDQDGGRWENCPLVTNTGTGLQSLPVDVLGGHDGKCIAFSCPHLVRERFEAKDRRVGFLLQLR